MNSLGASEKKTLDRQAIKNTIEILKKSGGLTHFLTDLMRGKHKEWICYKEQYSILAIAQSKKRHRPYKHNEGGCASPKDMIRMANFSTATSGYSSLNLGRYRTNKEKCFAILKADIPPQIKAELLIANGG